MGNQKHLTIVIKLGTSSIVDEKTHQPLRPILSRIVGTVVQLRNEGHKVVLVSSGAIGLGLRRMDMEKRPKQLARVQALAAVGQCRLMSLWDKLFDDVDQPVAQILLTRNDIADRTQYLNAQNTMNELLAMGVVPIVNENDTLAVAEIKFGDNDTLSAITAVAVHADYLFLMTDVDCLYDKNPRNHPEARPIEVVEDVASLKADVSSAGSNLGTGGMYTKIVAAQLATSAGVTTVITRSSTPGNIPSILSHSQSTGTAASTGVDSTSDAKSNDRAPLHTRFLRDPHPIRDRYFWILHGLAPYGKIYIDNGAYQALLNKAGLLPAGIVEVEGSFGQHEAATLIVVTKRHRQEAATPAPAPINVPIDTPSPVDALRTKETQSFMPSRSSGSGTSTPLTSVALYAPATKYPSPSSEFFELYDTDEVGRAQVNYSATEISRIKGLKSSEIPNVLGYSLSEYVAFRDSISFFNRRNGGKAGATSVGGVAGAADASESLGKK